MRRDDERLRDMLEAIAAMDDIEAVGGSTMAILTIQLN